MPEYRWKFLDPEKMSLDSYYSLTINPEYQCDDMRSSNYLKRHELVPAYLIKKLDIGKDYFNYLLLPEIKGGRIHFHGYLQLKDILNFELTVMPVWKQNFSFEIDFINDNVKWFNYVTKQKHLWENNIYKVFKRSLKLIDCNNYIPAPTQGAEKDNIELRDDVINDGSSKRLCRSADSTRPNQAYKGKYIKK